MIASVVGKGENDIKIDTTIFQGVALGVALAASSRDKVGQWSTGVLV